ncbi:putative protein RED [Helianthus annuus]|uniref:Putative RED-like protein n=1 Tax=Helianthus annuus TaxID=4232 RepID=A0A251SZC8_HELAN|nr:putative protein RED [Helianthus annuus]KAJ0503802.1 putative protein RED [Helianthus annuus]
MINRESSKEDHPDPVSFRTGNVMAVYQWIVKPQTVVKQNDMFLPGRMAFIFDMESGFSHDIPTTVHRSKPLLAVASVSNMKWLLLVLMGLCLIGLGKLCLTSVLVRLGRFLRRRRRKTRIVKDYIVMMTQEEKDRGLGSVFKRDDMRLQQLREKDAREKDPNFISESYSECYPGYQEYNREVVDSDDEDDLSKMDMGGRGRLHRWDFETEEEWATYNEQKEAMPKAAFQFGVKMQDRRKTRKQNKDQKLLTNSTRLTRYSPQD